MVKTMEWRGNPWMADPWAPVYRGGGYCGASPRLVGGRDGVTPLLALGARLLGHLHLD